MPLVINKSQKKVFEKAGIDTSNMIENQSVSTVEITQQVKVNENGAATHVRVLGPDRRVLRDWAEV